MSKDLINAAIQLAISLGGAGLVVQLLMLRQNRRKVAGDASSSEANAASTLSGAAIKMVENAQAKELLAASQRDKAHDQLEEERRDSDDRRERDAQELEARAWRIHHLEVRRAVLTNALLAAGVPVPPEPDVQTIRAIQEKHDPPAIDGPRISNPFKPSGDEPDLG